MTSRRVFVGALLTLAAAPLLSGAQTCAAANAAKKECAPTPGPKLNATGAEVLGGCPKKTKIKITCAKCGKTVEQGIDTPAPGKPYAQEWTCPKCGNKQKVSVETATPPA